MEAFFAELGEKPFRARQVLQWIHQYGVDDFSQMSNLSKALRAKLDAVAEVRPPELVQQMESVDGTRKWLIRVSGGSCIETVFIPEKKTRHAMCVLTGRLLVGLQFLRYRKTGVSARFNGGRNRRSAVVGGALV
jgi:23S rRNA (adenine2503-C2)-methyltransferase